MCVCMFMSVWMYVCACVCVWCSHMCTCMLVWKAVMNFQCHFPRAINNLFETVSLTETRDSLIWLGCLSREPKESACVHLPSSGIIGICHHTGFVVLLCDVAFGAGMQGLMPTYQEFYQLSPVPSPTRTLGAPFWKLDMSALRYFPELEIMDVSSPSIDPSLIKLFCETLISCLPQSVEHIEFLKETRFYSPQLLQGLALLQPLK